ncbi:NusG domain II-containing protein [Paenibacillus sp. SC116]|uniref:NusG domain II-containing protein n=1 Tax=Paenibacillus sp. SC116 TaxID=2968986 RepID=UPI00215AD269|nr:NusG domain II-containing protein [Paenibacillus sp. SC116]MCR8844663.1 NusG domain II-containing protein [Paenibacillus sp. SC116]
MKRGDIVIICLVIVAALAFFIPKWLIQNSSENNHNMTMTAEITVDGKLFKQVTLTEEEQIITVPTDHGTNVLKVHNHGIEMIEADCPDQVCLSFGFVSRKGDTIVCLPHRVLVELKTDQAEESEIDAVVS